MMVQCCERLIKNAHFSVIMLYKYSHKNQQNILIHIKSE